MALLTVLLDDARDLLTVGHRLTVCRRGLGMGFAANDAPCGLGRCLRNCFAGQYRV